MALEFLGISAGAVGMLVLTLMIWGRSRHCGNSERTQGPQLFGSLANGFEYLVFPRRSRVADAVSLSRKQREALGRRQVVAGA